MTEPTYEPPSLTAIGTLHELTLQLKDFSGVDGIILQNPGPGPDTPLGNAS